MYSTPILFLIFNRPEKTRLSFESIKRCKPKYLYIAADGPRKERPQDLLLCKETRDIVSIIDWPCEVKTLFRDENLGCGPAPASAIDWFFDNVTEGIILEDDCIPDSSFFHYCEELLEKYRDNEKIMHIGGCNFQDKKVTKDSYYFSNYIHVWGWATWKRAWSKFRYDVKMDNSFDAVLKQRFSNKSEVKFWKNYISNTFEHATNDVWDVQWVYAIFMQGGVSTTPAVNLVSNIGYGNDATHTPNYDPNWSEKQTGSLDTIIHPKKIKVNKYADDYVFKKMYKPGNTTFNKIKFSIGQRFPIIKKTYLKIVGSPKHRTK